jgi:hypothetical protein
MPRKEAKGGAKEKPARGGKLSLYGLTIEEAIRAAAQTGRPPPEKPKRSKREPKKPG